MTVNTADEKEAVTRVLEAHWAAVKAKDADAVMALVTEDFLSCGSAPEEFWNKDEMYASIKQMFANSDLKLDITVDRRIIRVSRDSNSAIALEQMFLLPYSSKIAVRTVYHLIREKGRWLIDFSSTAFIPENEHIDRLNKALD